MCSVRATSTKNRSPRRGTSSSRLSGAGSRPGRPRPSRAVVATLAAIIGLGSTALLGSRAAHAKAQRTAHWRFEQVWPAAIRFLRIDEGHEILEKDSEAGYVIFKVKDDGKEYQGALEVVSIVENRRPSVRLSLRIADRPDYMAEGILRRLLYKLQEELGPPPAPPPPKEKPAEEKPEEQRATLSSCWFGPQRSCCSPLCSGAASTSPVRPPATRI